MESFKLTVLLWGLLALPLGAQDSFFRNFYGNEASFNPAYVGQRGATRVGGSFRTQWGAETARAYEAKAVTFEESLPCFFMDYGLFARMDTEGEGELRTSEFGLRVAAKVPLTGRKSRNTINLRGGFGLTRGQRTIDFDRLVFLDQLDDFFGLVDEDGVANPTDFVPPSGSISPWYTSSNLGLVLRGQFPRTKNRTTTVDLGVAMHNADFLTGTDARQTASLLGLDNPLGQQLVVSGRADYVFAYASRRYWSVLPSVVYRSQDGLAYLEAGAGISWNRNLTLGAYYHQAKPQNYGGNVNWTSVQAELGSILPGGKTRVDVAISYAFQYGYLKNYVAPPLELTATFSFGKSTSCALMGFDGAADLTRSDRMGCNSFVTRRNHIYDNIWYQPERKSRRL